jgi:1,4-dihydroxy-2-naphthoyl-CoA hydrolase
METDPILPQPRTEHLDSVLGLQIKEASPDRVVAVLPVTPKLHQAFGIVHGGVYATMAETTASLGAALALVQAVGADGVARPGDPAGGAQVVGISNHTEFLRAVRDGELRAEANPVTRGRTTQLWRVEITDEAGRLVAHSSVRLMNLSTAP